MLANTSSSLCGLGLKALLLLIRKSNSWLVSHINSNVHVWQPFHEWLNHAFNQLHHPLMRRMYMRRVVYRSIPNPQTDHLNSRVSLHLVGPLPDHYWRYAPEREQVRMDLTKVIND